MAPKNPKTPKSETAETKAPLTIMVPDRLGRALRTIAMAEGTTLSRIFLDAVEPQVPARLKAALASLKDANE